MSFFITSVPRLLAAVAMFAFSHSGLAANKLVDSASLEAGSGTKVQMVRIGFQTDWDRRWFEGDGRHLGIYFDTSLSQWRGDAYQNIRGRHQDITNIGFTPVLRYRADNLKGWYAEGGIGIHLLSKRYNNADNMLSTLLQFGDHLGAGYVFDNKWDVTVKIQHYSNGGFKKPNSGVNFLVLKVARPF